MATMNISMPDPMKTWVEEQAKAGRYTTASDYVRDLIRRDQDRQAALTDLQRLVAEGLESGPAEPFDMDAYLEAKRRGGARRDTLERREAGD